MTDTHQDLSQDGGDAPLDPKLEYIAREELALWLENADRDKYADLIRDLRDPDFSLDVNLTKQYKLNREDVEFIWRVILVHVDLEANPQVDADLDVSNLKNLIKIVAMN